MTEKKKETMPQASRPTRATKNGATQKKAQPQKGASSETKRAAEGKGPSAKKQKPTPRPEASASRREETKAKAPSRQEGTAAKSGGKGTAAKAGAKRPSRAAEVRPVRVGFLGGLGEIGKNMCLLECGNDILVIDAGVAFPDDEMPGVDLVIPDITYLRENLSRVRGIFLTHGHEDHIGGVPYVLREVPVPVYGTALTLGILRNKLEEMKLPKKPDLRTVQAGNRVEAGVFTVEFIHVNHSIPDATALAIHTPVGIVYHTGDFKLDVSPIDGQMMDLGRMAEIGREGVTLLMGESTNAERDGFTPSERRVGHSLEHLFTKYPDKRLVIATFSSNVHRVQQIVDTSARHGRRVVVFGRSMTSVVGAAVELGYITVPEGTLIGPQDMKRFRPEELTLLTTGSQGEPMSALYRMAFGEHDRVTLTTKDVVVLSAKAIPGNEKLVGKIVNTLVAAGIRVETDDSIEDIHVSGHACSEELKLVMALLRPRYFMPIHGEARHLFAHREIAAFMGIPSENIFLGENGKMLEIGAKGARWSTPVPAGQVLIDGAGIGDVGATVLRDRKLLSEDGLIAVVATVDREEGLLLSGPEIVSRGFVYVKEAEDLMDEVRTVSKRTLCGLLDRGVTDWSELKGNVRDEISRLLFKKTKRRPMILPILMDL